MTPGSLDAAAIRRHLLAMDEALQVLRRHQGRPVAVLTENAEERWVVERGLQLCAQNPLDIETHLAASAGHEVTDYAAAIDRLAELELLPRPFASRFRAVAGFRNVIVHGYLRTDVAVVHGLLNERLEDFSEFARLVKTYLGSR